MRSSRAFVTLSGLAAIVLASTPLYAAKTERKKDSSASVTTIPRSETLKASRHVDKLVEQGYAKHKVEPNPISADETFVRRLYLDVVGRIPTYAEITAFLASEDPEKRSRLIDTLLDSDGYVSHNFNYWADLLRVQSRMRYAPSRPYLDFIKDSLRENKPYDQFVRELITAEGYTWDNGAAGYYLRDTGMPLDNMSNTVQVFLGTQLVCAQCHDHPFDSWTQKQYYELAAFTYGVETRDRRHPMYMKVRKMRRDKEVDQEVVRAASRILQPLAYRVHESDRKLKLPDDYQYDDAKPKDAIDPAAIFGEDVVVRPGDSRKEIYARWMTSPKNPRFANVIANRLWKRVMGVGVIEPVDDIKDDIEPSNPKLMKFLAKTMVDSEFNLKQYLRVLLNSQTYQRDVSVEELSADKPYHFPGPVLRRLSAEQLWDSLLAVTIPDVDQRTGLSRDYNRYANGQELVDKDVKEILKMAEVEAKRRKVRYEYQQATARLQKEYRIASRTQEREKMTRLRNEMAEIREKIYGPEGEMRMKRDAKRSREQRRERDPRWAGFSKELVRASEVTSPARPGHFLRQFGQSDRETIENSNQEATVPQILTLLNGPVASQLANRNSLLSKNLASADKAEDKLDVIYLSILSRRPTEREQQLALPRIKEAGDRGASDVVWALINTRQFVFVQ